MSHPCLNSAILIAEKFKFKLISSICLYPNEMIASESSGNSEYLNKNTLGIHYGHGQSMVTNIICVQTLPAQQGMCKQAS